MSLIKDAIDTIAKLAEARKPRLEVIDLPRRKLLLDQQSGEVAPLFVHPATRSLNLGDIASLRAWCATENDGGDVVVGRTGPTRATSPAAAHPHERSVAEVSFFDAFIPKGPMNLRAFIAWLDLIRAGIAPDDVKDIDICMRAVSVVDDSSVTVAQSGAALTVKVSAGKGLSTERPFPKRFTAVIPFGDPSFITPVGFSTTLETRGSELIATVAIDELELSPDGTASGPRARFVDWARDQLSGLERWTVMVGA